MENLKDYMRWFMDARFGMFIHWGLYAIPARGEWVRHFERISNEDYQKYFEEFNPDQFDARQWAKLAKTAGMKYAVLTAKHHDGFCLFDSKLTDYKATETPFGRDIVREYAEAFRAEGLKVGLYYSLIDWHHEDYPAYGDKFHPMRDNEAYRNRVREFPRYLDYMHGQVRELLSNYGRIDIIWFDFSYGEMSGETWRATELVKMIRSLQPGIVIDNRLGGNIYKPKNQEIYAGDYASPEQVIPPYGVLDDEGRPIPWEACITHNNNWGYYETDKNFKSAQQIVRALVECVSKGGNMLLNIGPDARGRIPAESVETFTEVGRWMELNGASIYGCGRCSIPKPEWGRFTEKDGKIYAHIYERGIGPVNVNGMNGKIKKMRFLADGAEIRMDRPWSVESYPDDAFIMLEGAKLPDEIDTVVELALS
ncbi:MAG: alpha-L-fucosidase [Bacillota bacterium]